MKQIQKMISLRKNRDNKRLLLVTLCLTAILFPQFALAQGDPVTSMLDTVANNLTGNWARGAALIVLAICGYLAWIGQLAWKWIIGFVVGCVFIFGGAELLSLWEGGV